MKPTARNFLIAGALAFATTGAIAAQPANTWFEQWHNAKFGRPTPAQEARLNAERENVAFREAPAVVLRNDWFEKWHQAKFGRPTPAEEARRKAASENEASREEAREFAPAPTWSEQYQRAKFGRLIGK